MRQRLLVAVLLLLAASPLAADGPPALDGPHRPMSDALLDHLVGTWNLSGVIQGEPAEQRLTASWVLNHQFLQLEFEGLGAASEGEPRYAAEVYLGYDNTSERYVAHWIDVFGGRFSGTLGYGMRAGERITLRFEYPDGPFENTFTWRPEVKSWQLSLRGKQPSGEWRPFAELTATAAASQAAAAVAPDAATLEDQVRATETAFAKTMAERDHGAFASFIADEAVFVGRSVLRGRQAVTEGWKSFFEAAQAPFAWAPERVVVLASGTLALSSGPVFGPDGRRGGTFNSVWRREADGAWKIVLDSGCPPCEGR